MLVNELHFQYNLRHGLPYDIVDKGNGKRYFVEYKQAKVVSNNGETGLFFLPLLGMNGTTYVLRWHIDGEFDTYLGSTPKIPLSHAPVPFHLKLER